MDTLKVHPKNRSQILHTKTADQEVDGYQHPAPTTNYNLSKTEIRLPRPSLQLYREYTRTTCNRSDARGMRDFDGGHRGPKSKKRARRTPSSQWPLTCAIIARKPRRYDCRPKVPRSRQFSACRTSRQRLPAIERSVARAPSSPGTPRTPGGATRGPRIARRRTRTGADAKGTPPLTGTAQSSR